MRLNNRIYDGIFRAIFLLAYFLPYGFVAVMLYCERGQTKGIVFAAVAFLLLAVLTGITHHRLIALGGLILSSVSSFALTWSYPEEWAEAVAPLTPVTMLGIIMAIALVAHLIIWHIINKLEPEDKRVL